jgi:hypothetical protein
MTIREILRKDIWSKRTSRIIASAVLLLCGIGLLWTDWATPREKRLARVAMTKVDSITDPEGISQVEFDARYAEAKSAAGDAKAAAITLRDRVAAFVVANYVSDLEHRRTILSLPDAKLGQMSPAEDKVLAGREKKLQWLAQDLEMHERQKAVLVSIVGNAR